MQSCQTIPSSGPGVNREFVEWTEIAGRLAPGEQARVWIPGPLTARSWRSTVRKAT